MLSLSYWRIITAALSVLCGIRWTVGFAPGPGGKTMMSRHGRGREVLPLRTVVARAAAPLQQTTTTRLDAKVSSSSSFAVSSAELDKDLSAEEKTVVSVVRRCGPSVAYVISILAAPSSSTTTGRSQRGGAAERGDSPMADNGLPRRGQSLGSGSGFVVDSRGYIVTNFHVVEQAYRFSEVSRNMDELSHEMGNATTSAPWGGGNILAPLLSRTVQRFAIPEVYVRLDSTSSFQKCRFVDVRPDLDLAVLKLITNGTTTTDDNNNMPLPALSFGSSSDLLVGQSLVAIGNPFGLASSVTTGVVSALNRQLSTSNGGRGRGGFMTGLPTPPISNCIQTDCAINPGNSGGPLLNLRGQVVGVNTAIVSTTGSNAGIGFAISSDQDEPAVRDMIRNDDAKHATAWLGIYLLKQRRTRQKEEGEDGPAATTTGGTKPPHKKQKGPAGHDRRPLLLVGKVAPGSPAARADIRGIYLARTEARYGDAIVAVNGNFVHSYDDLRRELARGVIGERLALTVEDVSTHERRVVYLTLEAKAPHKAA
jgi:S1-C subfamily serine protease